MRNILLVSDNKSHRALLEGAIDRRHCLVVEVLNSSDRLLLKTRSGIVDMVVLALDNNGSAQLEDVRRLMEQKAVPVVMFVEKGDRDSAANATAAGVSAYVVNGLQAERIVPVLAAAATRFEETQALREELAKTRASLQERKTVERAKGLLMEQRACNENEAYKALRQMAMQRNKRLADIAQGVIDSIELLSASGNAAGV